MNLEDFVKNSIVSIVNGVKKAQEQLGADCVNPERHMRTNEDSLVNIGYFVGQNKQLVQSLDFDVAVTLAKNREKTAEIGIIVATLGGRTSGKARQEEASTSRIKFKVPISFPL